MTLEPLAPIPGSGHIFETAWRLTTFDMDENHHLRLDAVARYLQEAGAMHLEHVGMMDEHPHWIVRRTVVDVIRPIQWPGQIRVRRWCSGISPRWCTMRVRIDGPEGGLIETEGFWINMNKQTMGPSRLSDPFFDLMATTASEHRLKWRPWLIEPLANEPGIPFPLRRTDVDHFEHVNNTAYWHGIHEVTTELAEPAHRFVIEYAKPISLGEQVRIHTRRIGNALNIWFAVDGDVRSLARISSPPSY